VLKKGRSVRVRSLHCCSVIVVFLRRTGKLRLHMRRAERRRVEKGAFLSRSLDSLDSLARSPFLSHSLDSLARSPFLSLRSIHLLARRSSRIRSIHLLARRSSRFARFTCELAVPLASLDSLARSPFLSRSLDSLDSLARSPFLSHSLDSLARSPFLSHSLDSLASSPFLSLRSIHLLARRSSRFARFTCELAVPLASLDSLASSPFLSHSLDSLARSLTLILIRKDARYSKKHFLNRVAHLSTLGKEYGKVFRMSNGRNMGELEKMRF